MGTNVRMKTKIHWLLISRLVVIGKLVDTLKIPNAWALVFFRLEIFFVLEKKCHHKINDDGRAEGEERNINKVKPDFGGFNSHFLPEPGAHTEERRFNKFPEAVEHSTNLRKTN